MTTTSAQHPEQRTALPQDWTEPHPGPVVLVVAGPGDPDLLTIRGREALGAADVIVSDPEVVDIAEQFAASRCEVVPARGDDGQPLTHNARAAMVAALSENGKVVARLLAGDPIMDGSLRLEAEGLLAAGLQYEVAPGVSPLTGIPAFAGFGLTGGRVREVRVVDADDPQANLEPSADGRATLVVLNGAHAVADLAKRLVAAGWPGDTPAAVTFEGATVDQRTVTSVLAELPVAAKTSGLTGSGPLVVGEVVDQERCLSWFESKPLFGWRVLVPRTKDQAATLSERLRTYGAVPVEVPTISVEPPRTPQQMERAVHGLVSGRYEWIAFTSANAVRAVCEKFQQYGLDARSFAGLKVAAIGEQTAAALRAFGVNPDLMPAGEQNSLGLLDVWPDYDETLDPINRVFLPRADIATDTLVAGITDLGWEVDDITAYRTVRAAPPPAPIREAIKTGGFDAVLFTSSSTVRNLIGIAGKPHASTVIACIGPATAATAEEHGLRVHVRAERPSAEVLADGLARHGETLRVEALAGGSTVWRPSKRRTTQRRRAN
jgi:uroporphyrinogen III methyltransferase/synthase